MKRKSRKEKLVSVQIRPQIARLLLRYVKQGMSRDEIINEALRQYFVEKELQEIRQKMLPLAQSKGIYADKDVDRFRSFK